MGTSTILIRRLDDSVKEALAAQAATHGRSMEAEARDIITRATIRQRHRHIGLAFLEAGRQSGGVEDLPVPARDDAPRHVTFE